MLIRSFFNAKGDPYYVLGFESEHERTRMFEALNQSDVFLTPLGKRMEFSDLVRRLSDGIPATCHEGQLPSPCRCAARR